MKYSVIILLSLVLIVGITAPSHAQTITDHVVINEVDTNPPGDDSQFISEWVELYNPTNDDVDLSGWQISSSFIKKIYTIPDGTIISSGDFLTFVNEKLWFTDTAESVELRNTDGIVIDKTREIFDLENDLKSWQRTSDGYSEWKFVTATAGGSNGVLSTDEIFDTVVVTVSSDKSSYIFDETALISGTVSKKLFVEKPTFQTEPIKINISGPNFYQSVSLYPDSYLNYETTLNLIQVLGISEGTYNISVIYGGVSSTTEFSVGFATIEEESELIGSSFNIQSDKSEYIPGELVSVDGVISEIIPFESVTFSIVDSNGKLVSSGNLFPSDGKFSTSIFLTTVNPNYGVYTITTEYDDQIRIINFDVVENTTDESLSDAFVPDSMIFNLDQSEYLLNDYMTLSGEISNFDSGSDIYYQVVYFNFKDSNGKVPTMASAIMDKSDGSQDIEFSLTAIPDDSGKFSIISRIPQVVFTEGDYTVKANYGGIIGLNSFSLVTEKSLPDEKSDIEFNVKTVIEKVNRISDNSIPIIISEKIIDDELVKPRVLSGSMITTSKDNVSDVNLRVLSSSGVCVIGTDVDCLVSESTRKPGQIFDVVQIDGQNLNVRYTGPDVRLEKFSILPVSSDEFLLDANWNVEVIKDDEISRFYYKLTYKTSQ